MIKNYLTVAIRNLFRHKIYSAINTCGLGIGIAFCILTYLYVRHELSYDTFHRDSDSIYRMVTVRKNTSGETEITALQPAPLGPTMVDEFAEVKRSARFILWTATFQNEAQPFKERVLFSDPSIFEMFSFSLLKGNPNTALRSPDSVVMTEDIARKYFGDENPLGQRIAIKVGSNTRDFIVTGIARKPPDTSTIKFSILLPYEISLSTIGGSGNWGGGSTVTYIELSDNIHLTKVESQLQAFVGKHFGPTIDWGQKGGYLSTDSDAWRMLLQPLSDVHLGMRVATFETIGNPVYLYVLSGIAILVLVIACINFMNLSIGLSSKRTREIGTRKVVGATRSQIAKQFLVQSFMLTLIAMFLGIGLGDLFLPTFNDLTGKSLTTTVLTQGPSLAFLLGLVVLVGMVSGSYPAMALSRFHPVEVLKGRLRIGSSSKFSRGLVVVQFTLSIFLLIAAGIMAKQVDFLQSKDLGFNGEQVVVIPAFSVNGRQIIELYRRELFQYDNFINMAGSSWNCTGSGAHGKKFIQHGDRKIEAFNFGIDYTYLETLGIQLAEGRNFSRNHLSDAKKSVIVNETLVKQFGWDSAVGKKLKFGEENIDNPTVIGVVKDFHYKRLHNKVEPLVLYMGEGLYYISVRISPVDIPGALGLLERKWLELAPDSPFEYSFLGEDMARLYESEERSRKIFGYASWFAVFIASLGAFGLMALAAA